MYKNLDELIVTNKYDEIFKNTVRDYYTYGFKSFCQYYRSRKSLEDNWKILGMVLGDKWYFEKGKKGRRRIVLKTPGGWGENPLDRLYYLHRLSYMGDFLNYLLILDPETQLRPGGISQSVIETELEKIEDLRDADEVEFAIMNNWLETIGQPDGRLQKDFYFKPPAASVMINRQLNLLSPSTYFFLDESDKYKNLSARTKYLSELGILGNLKNNTAKRNSWLAGEWQKYAPESRRYFSAGARTAEVGHDYWFKSGLTMEALMEYGRGQYEKPKGNSGPLSFDQRFADLCGFFARCCVFGEIGTFLKRRLDVLQMRKEEIFRFKHNYLQKSLYDYNLLDLFLAIENRRVCWIRYSHGTNLDISEYLAVLLEIRVSVSNGREYVLFYDVESRRIGALRIEFIDRIIAYKEIKRAARVERKRKNGSKENCPITEIRIDHDDIARQSDIARQMLPYIWGAQVDGCLVDEDWKTRLKTYWFQVEYDDKREYYVKERIKKEHRQQAGTWEKKKIAVTCFPTKELRSWLRSFYLRIQDGGNVEESGFNLHSDIDAVWKLYCSHGRLKEDFTAEKKAEADTYLGYDVEGTEASWLGGHGALFNELFSSHAAVLANAVLACSGQEKKDFDSVLEQKLLSEIFYYNGEPQKAKQAASYLKFFAEQSQLFDREGKARYETKKKDYFYQLLPLTKIEYRWLSAVLEAPLSEIFLPQELCRKLLAFLKEKAPYEEKALPLDTINYFDGYKKPGPGGRDADKHEICCLKRIYEAMSTGRKLRLRYINAGGQQRGRISEPAWLEYSCRDQVFRIWDQYAVKGVRKAGKINVSRILEMEEEGFYSLQEARQLAEKDLERSMTSLKAEFYQGDKNLPDRILTEFSLWKKKCVYDEKTGKYAMYLYYPKEDEKEILIRFLAYGPYVKITSEEDGNYVCQEIQRRIERQRERIRAEEAVRE